MFILDLKHILAKISKKKKPLLKVGAPPQGRGDWREIVHCSEAFECHRKCCTLIIYTKIIFCKRKTPIVDRGQPTIREDG
jgi:hypothetical protein